METDQLNFNMSDSIKELASALTDFQANMEAVKKDAKNPFFKSKYASLANILDAIREPLARNGLSFSQLPIGDSQLITVLMHKSGEWMRATVQMKPTKNEPQAIGSAITYMRRYALTAVLGLSTDEDDDGNLASAPSAKLTTRR